jgi:hypothetical protein
MIVTSGCFRIRKGASANLQKITLKADLFASHSFEGTGFSLYIAAANLSRSLTAEGMRNRESEPDQTLNKERP